VRRGEVVELSEGTFRDKFGATQMGESLKISCRQMSEEYAVGKPSLAKKLKKF